MPWILAGGGVVVVAIVVVLIIVLTGGSDTSSPEGVAEAAVSAFNDQDVDGITDITCSANKSDVEDTLGNVAGPSTSGPKIEATAKLGKVETQGDDKATAQITFTYTNVPDEMKEIVEEGSTQEFPLALAKEGGDWCVSGLGAPSGD
jgi:hypothetical protein